MKALLIVLFSVVSFTSLSAFAETGATAKPIHSKTKTIVTTDGQTTTQSAQTVETSGDETTVKKSIEQTDSKEKMKASSETTYVDGEKVSESTKIETEPSTAAKAKAQARKAEKAVEATIANAGDRRAASHVTLMAEYSWLDLILPSKVGGAIGYVRSREETFELEYLGASYSAPFFIKDIGGFSDKRVSLLVRSYAQRNSFNFHYGISYFDMGIHVGNELLKSASNLPAYADLLSSRSIGLIFGIGNRWVFPHGFTLGVDWLSWAQPLILVQEDSSIINNVQDQTAKTTLQDAFHLSEFCPRITVLKVSAGFTF